MQAMASMAPTELPAKAAVAEVAAMHRTRAVEAVVEVAEVPAVRLVAVAVRVSP